MPVLVQPLLEHAAAQIIRLPKLNLPDGNAKLSVEIRAFAAAFENQAVLNTRIGMRIM